MRFNRSMKIFTLLLVFLTQAGLSETLNSQQKVVLQDDDYHFEVRTDPSGKNIFIETLASKQTLPNDMSITIFDGNRTGRTVSLQLIKTPALSQATGTQRGKTLPTYQGSLDPFSGSIIGAELQIGLGGAKAPRILRWGKH